MNHYTRKAAFNGCAAVACLIVAIFFNVFAAIRLWDHRNHVVSESRVTTDYDAPYRMYLDEPFETRVASGELGPNERSEAIPTEEQGNGQYYFPNAPKWDGDAWSFEGTSLYWIEKLEERVNFTGPGEDGQPIPDGFIISLFTLPCDVPFDEVLFGLAICLYVRALLHSVYFARDWAKHSAFALYGAEKRVPKDTDFHEKVDKAMKLMNQALGAMVLAMTVLYLNSSTCERDVPDLFYLSAGFLLIFWAGMIVVGVVKAVYMIWQDSDPGPCPASEGRRSATSVLLPCKHDIHYSYEAAAAMILGNECPVCYRLVEDVQYVRRGVVSVTGLAVVALVQMIAPFYEVYWHLWHTACFAADPPYTEYTTGCMFGQYIGVIMLLNGILGVYVAETHGKAKRAAKIYLVLNYITLVYTWVQTVIFQAAASGRFTQSLSKARVRELRENGMGFDEMREQSHHSWSYLSGDCNIDNRGSLSYQIFSCRPCDKTDPSSCRGERQWEANQRLTTQAAMAFLADFVLAGLAIMLFKGLQRTNRRQHREQFHQAKLEFLQMLEAEEEVNEETPLKELDKVEESSSASSSFSVRDALVSSCRNFAAKFIPRRATPTQPVEQTPDAAFANVMSAMDGSTTGQNKPQQRRRRSSAAKHGDSDSSGSEEDTSDEEDEKKGGPGPPSVAEGSGPASRGEQTRSYAVPERSTWHTRIKNDDRFHPKTLSAKNRRDVLVDYQRRLRAEKRQKEAL